MTDVYEFSEFQRNNLIYDFVTLTPEEREQKKLNYQKFEAEKAAEKAAKKPVTPAAEIKAEVKVKTETPPPSSDNSQQSNLKELGENKGS